MIVLLLLFAVVLLLFGFVLLFGAPYLPTLSKQQAAALDLLDLKPGQTLLELGSGDGRMLAVAARRGIKAVGYELNPLLAMYSWLMTRRYRGLVTVKWANFWRVKLPETDGIYVFLLDRYMSKLYKKIIQENGKSIKLVSFAFEIPEIKHTKEKSGLYLYIFDNKQAPNDRFQGRDSLNV